MEKMSDLRDLLKHEVYDLHSAEEQIIKALPAMIEKANNTQLKLALEEHLRVTQKQLMRLEQAQVILNGEEEMAADEKKGLLARLFSRRHTCRGMQGLIEEGEKIMGEKMSPEVLDAAIIACAQKIEHYEICGYGTAKAYARELELTKIGRILEETLNEEYEADNRLTALAVARLNKKAEEAGEKLTPSDTVVSLQENNSEDMDEAPLKKRHARDLEPELVSDESKTTNSKRQSAKNKAPKGEAGRSEKPRQSASKTRVTANNSNSKPAKTSAGRKSVDSRSQSTKNKRSR
jgi:ferritin-like metal-binding protein YciE